MAFGRAAVVLLSGLVAGVVPPAVVLAQTAPTERAAAPDPFGAHIAEASQLFGIPEHWIRAVLHAESAGNLRAVSSAGAMGLMQIMPGTWAELQAHYGLGDDPFDPRENVLAGAAYLRAMYDRYGNVGAMLAAYNAGPGRYDEHLATGRPLPAETRAYVALLAPLLGAEPPPDIVIAVPSPPADWRDAPLFVARFGAPSAPIVPSGGTPGDPSAAAAPHADGALPGTSDAIFVSRSGAGGPP